jgi:penicillin-binding protein-related factor A (putative recombinase)
MMMSDWRDYEKRIQEESDLRGYLCLRFPVENRIVNAGFSIKVKSKPDFLVSVGGRAVLFDAKSTQDTRWNLKENVFRKDNSANKLHQWHQLVAARDKGTPAGYLIWFKSDNKIVWASVENIEALVQDGHSAITVDSPHVQVINADEPIDVWKFVS